MNSNSIEQESLIYMRHDNGIHHFILQDNSVETTDRWFAYFEDIINTSGSEERVYLLCDGRAIDGIPSYYGLKKLKEMLLRNHRVPDVYWVYVQSSQHPPLSLAFLQFLYYMPIKLNGRVYTKNEYAIALKWLRSKMPDFEVSNSLIE